MEVIAHGALFTWMMEFAEQGAKQYFADLRFDWGLVELVMFVPGGRVA
jgi:hypothetical protein